jgi:subtilisin family serine protease
MSKRWIIRYREEPDESFASRKFGRNVARTADWDDSRVVSTAISVADAYFSDLSRNYYLTASEEEIQDLRGDDPRIEAVEEDSPIKLNLQAASPPSIDYSRWGMKEMNVHEKTPTGKGVRVAVLDSGWTSDHPDFLGKNIVEEYNADTPKTAPKDYSGHGTSVLGILAGGPLGPDRYAMAPECELLIGRVLKGDELQTRQFIDDGVSWAIQKNARIINLSLGWPTNQATAWNYRRWAEELLSRANVLVVASAGNGSKRASGIIRNVFSPADAKDILAVGYVTQNLQIGDMSTRSGDTEGAAIDLVAPGSRCETASSNFGGAYGPRTAFDLSSAAAPHVSGLAALYWEAHSSWTAKEVWKAICETARSLGHSEADQGAGLGQWS